MDRCPLLALALAAGAFGAISTRASRADEAATINIAADVLRPNVERFVAGGGTLSDAALAINLPEVLIAAHRAPAPTPKPQLSPTSLTAFAIYWEDLRNAVRSRRVGLFTPRIT